MLRELLGILPEEAALEEKTETREPDAVSYTHLDVYKRQEVDREVMKALRNEEKKLRRSYDAGGASDSEDSKDAQPSTCLLYTSRCV